MVILDAISLDLDNKVDHLATTWQVSDLPDFSNILLKSEENYKDKLTIIFNDNLDPNIKYYGRARALLSSGWTEWGNVEIFKVRNNTDLRPQDVFPTRVSIPQLKTYRMITDTGVGVLDDDSIFDTPDDNTNPTPTISGPTEGQLSGEGDDQEFNDDYDINVLLHEINPEEHDLTLFEIWARGFQVIGNAKHIATSWWIENSEGDIVWSSLVNKMSLTKIAVKDIILKSEEVYRIRAVFHTNSNDVSQIGTYSIVTGGADDINLVTYLDQVPFNRDLFLQLEWRDGMNSITWELLSLDLGIVTSIWKTTTTIITTTIPAGKLQQNKNYILRIKTNLSDGYKYYPFITTATTDESPDDPITPLLVYPTDITISLDETTQLFVESVAKNITFINNASEYVHFNETSKVLTGIKVGNGYLYIRAKMDGYAENIQKVNITVKASSGGGSSGGGSGNNSFLTIKPSEIEVQVGERQLLSVSTNTKTILVETDNDNVVATVNDRIITIVGMKEGNFTGIVVGYDLQNNATASAIITGRVIDTGVTPPPKPDPDPDPEEYTLVLNPKEVRMLAGNTTVAKVLTNAPFWDIRTQEGDFFTAKKLNTSQIQFTATGAGDGMLVVVASNSNGDVAEDVFTVSSTLQAGRTELIFDQVEYTGKINVNTEIVFTSNITSPEEYDVSMDTENIELVQKKASSVVIKAKYEAAGQSFPISITAKKNNTETTAYEEIVGGFTFKVEEITYTTDEVIKFPVHKEGDEFQDNNYGYKGGAYGDIEFYPPNPLEFTIYVHHEATESGIKLITEPYADGTGIVVNKILGEVIQEVTQVGRNIEPVIGVDRPTNWEDNDTSQVEYNPYIGFRPLTFYIKTGTGDNLGNPENSNIFTIKCIVTIRGIPYTKTLTLHPILGTSLNITPEELTMEKFSKDTDSLSLSTNASELKIVSSNTNVAYGEILEGKLVVYSGIDGTAVLTISGNNDSEVERNSLVKIIVGTGENTYRKPEQGEPGFGVGVAPLYLLNKYNLRPVDPDNVANPNHNKFGNYKDEHDNILVWIPKLYFYYDNNPSVVALARGKTYDDVDIWLLKASTINKPGYFLDRCFINAGKEIEGIFLDKYNISFSGDDLNLPRSVAGGIAGGKELITGKTVKLHDANDNTVQVIAPAEDNKHYLYNLPKNRGKDYSYADYFVYQLLHRIAIASYHGHILKGNESSHPWYSNYQNYPQPILLQSVTNDCYVKTVPYEGTQIQAYKSGGTKGEEFYKYISHNGCNCGVVDIHGHWTSVPGIIEKPSNNAGSTIKELYGYKLKTDRSSINYENITDMLLYDKYIIDIPEDKRNLRLNYKVAGKGISGPVYSNSTDINSVDYLLNSMSMTTYTNDIILQNPPLYDKTIMDKGYRTNLMIDLQNNRNYYCTGHLSGMVSSTHGCSLIFVEMFDNDLKYEPSFRHNRRICLIPNVGKELDISDTELNLKAYQVDSNDEPNTVEIEQWGLDTE